MEDPNKTSATRDVERAKERLHKERDAASGLMHEGRAKAGDTAASMASGLRDYAAERGDQVKDKTVGDLRHIAEAMRNMHEDLAAERPGIVADLVGRAAEGLDSVSGSLQGRGTWDMLDGLRDLGRRHPLGFIAGSVLAGVALGRFGASSTPRHTGQSELPGSTYHAGQSELPGSTYPGSTAPTTQTGAAAQSGTTGRQAGSPSGPAADRPQSTSPASAGDGPISKTGGGDYK